MRWLLAVTVLAMGCAARTRSETTAKALSGVGAGVSSAIVLSSFVADSNGVNRPLLYAGLGTSIVTPSLGELYAAQYVTFGMGVRAAAGALAVVGATRTRHQKCVVDPTQDCPEITNNGVALLGLAAIAYIGGVAYDVIDAPNAARRFNSRVRVGLAPMPMGNNAGLAVVGRF